MDVQHFVPQVARGWERVLVWGLGWVCLVLDANKSSVLDLRWF